MLTYHKYAALLHYVSPASNSFCDWVFQEAKSFLVRRAVARMLTYHKVVWLWNVSKPAFIDLQECLDGRNACVIESSVFLT
jgi:hypothetical protein